MLPPRETRLHNTDRAPRKTPPWGDPREGDEDDEGDEE